MINPTSDPIKGSILILREVEHGMFVLRGLLLEVFTVG